MANIPLTILLSLVCVGTIWYSGFDLMTKLILSVAIVPIIYLITDKMVD